MAERRIREDDLARILQQFQAEMERTIAQAFGVYHAKFHGTPPLATTETKEPA